MALFYGMGPAPRRAAAGRPRAITPGVRPLLRRAAVGLSPLLPLFLLGGCASLSTDGALTDVTRLTQQRLGQDVEFSPAPARPAGDGDTALRALLARPLTADAAVRIALLSNPGLKAAFAELGVAQADLVQAGRLRNPGISFGRVRNGGDGEIDRSVMFDLAGLLTLPARRNIEQGRFEQAKLRAAAQAVDLAAATRGAYFTAVAAAQSAAYAQRVREAADASAELAAGMAKAGNWSKLDQARERAFAQEAQILVARSAQEALASREQLVRLLGLADGAPALVLPERLPDLPAQPRDLRDAEALALSQRLDVLSAQRDTEATASALGLTRATGFINVFDAGYANKSSTGMPRENGYQVAFELPLFDWGGARVARAEAQYMQAVHRTADTALRARSDVRVAYGAYRSTYDIARRYRDQLIPLRKSISDEVLLRYNGMLASVFELLADAREQLTSVNAAIDAERDFWSADNRLQSAIHGGANETRSTP